MESKVNQRVKEVRIRLGLNQQELANDLNVTVVTISRIENGNNEPRKKFIDRLCNTYNVSNEWIYNGTGEMFLEGGAKVHLKSDSWRDEAYSQLKTHYEDLKQENQWLRNLVSKQNGLPANFNVGIASALDINPSNTVSEAA